jgi:hypothetical protein
LAALQVQRGRAFQESEKGAARGGSLTEPFRGPISSAYQRKLNTPYAILFVAEIATRHSSGLAGQQETPDRKFPLSGNSGGVELL